MRLVRLGTWDKMGTRHLRQTVFIVGWKMCRGRIVQMFLRPRGHITRCQYLVVFFTLKNQNVVVLTRPGRGLSD